MAAANGHLACATALLAAGAAPAAKNGDGNTPLHYACLNGHVHVVSALLAAGALPTALNNAERTPVDEALGTAHAESVLAAVRAAAASDGGAPGDATVDLTEGDDVEEGD
jgi:ankyrin repeat protein